jgi:hypothetical protein
MDKRKLRNNINRLNTPLCFEAATQLKRLRLKNVLELLLFIQDWRDIRILYDNTHYHVLYSTAGFIVLESNYGKSTWHLGAKTQFGTNQEKVPNPF